MVLHRPRPDPHFVSEGLATEVQCALAELMVAEALVAQEPQLLFRPLAMNTREAVPQNQAFLWVLIFAQASQPEEELDPTVDFPER